jgi:uncharacterized protein (DUF302 family)
VEQVAYGYGKDVALSPDDAVARVTEVLKDQGFGILSRIDVHAVMKAKLGVDMPPYVILGACNPNLASRAIAAEPQVGVLLPCNVLVKANAGGGSTVSIADPKAMGAMTTNGTLSPVMAEADERLRKALAAL